MRLWAGLAFAVGCGAASYAGAQTLTAPEFALQEAAFAPKTYAAAINPGFTVLDRETFTPEGEPIRWNTNEVQLAQSHGGAVDSLRLSVGGALRAPGGPLRMRDASFEADAYEVTVIRNWPAAVSFNTNRFDVDVSPHAGLGVSNLGGSAEAGAMVRLSKRSKDDIARERLQAMGIDDGAHFGDQGRWYMFAAASGRAVGMNMLRGDTGWDRAGWSTDPTSALIGDAQVGVGFRKGGMQTSLGYVHREVKGRHMIFGQQTRNDSMVAFSLSLRPKY